MKIAMVANPCSSHIIKWANAFAGIGHEVTIYAFAQHLRTKENLSPLVRVISIGRFSKTGAFRCANRLKTHLQTFKPNIVHVFYATVYAGVAKLSGVKPRIISVLGSDVYAFSERGFWARLLLKYNLSGCSCITSTSHAMKMQTRRFTKEPIHVIPFGVDTRLFKPLGKTDDSIRIAFVKLFKPVYAPQDMIRAFELLKKILKEQRHPLFDKVKLEMYGAGKLESVLHKQAAATEFAEDITFHGYIKNHDLPQALQQSDLFCATSLQESFGVSLVEAMACGLPVVCSNAQGFREIVLHGETGFILPRGDINGYAKALYQLVCDKDLRLQMGEKGRKRVEELFDFTACLNKILELYDETIRKN